MFYKKISVKDRLPEIGVFVVTIDVGGEMGIYRLTEYGWNMRDSSAFNSPNNNLEITHWLEEINEDSNEYVNEKNLISKARKFAINAHNNVNQEYDGKSYETHLTIVSDYAEKYLHLFGPDISSNDKETILASAWLHDTIEDCRKTYNDIKTEFNVDVAEIVYSLTNEKGKNRKERANSKYYEGIRKTKFSTFIKICDRLANIKYSKENGSRMFELYKKEYYPFSDALYSKDLDEMWKEMEKLLGI